jgi:hypothetical protein
MYTDAIRTLDKRWLLSFTSLPAGEIRVREQVAETPFSATCKGGRLARMQPELHELTVAGSNPATVPQGAV